MDDDFWAGTDTTNINTKNDFWAGTDAQDIKTQQSQPTWTDRAKEFGQGLASGVGGMADAANKLVGAGVVHTAGYVADVASYNAKKYWIGYY